MGSSIIKVDVLMAYPLDDDDDIYNMVLFNDGFSRVYVFEAHNGGVKQGVIDEQSTSVNVENNHFSSPSSSSSQGVNDDNTIQRHEVASRCIEFEAIPPVSSTLGKAISAGGCPWKITARGVGATKIVRVHTFENKHNHSAQEESSSVPALRPNKAALVIDDMIRANPDYLPRQICEDFERQHGVKLTYNQAWKCKEKAKERIFGLLHNSYKLLPWLCKQLMETNSGTIAEWTSSDEGALFSALAYDADDDMFPLAYAIASAIICSVAEVFGVENHAYCYRHLKEDFSHQLMMGREGKDNALKLLDAVAYASAWVKDEEHHTIFSFTEKHMDMLASYGKAKISVDMRQHTCTCLAWQMSGIHEMVYSGTLHPLEFQNLPTVHSDGNVHDPNGYVHVSLDPPVTKCCLGRPRRQRIRPNLENR
ncbi:hypothetical protein CK203_054745 [Vitis vinifera]|uniref:Uncharacterized protein n=1 Tax=Vitis vinifera TaxID=29760 RepID=A0A438H1M8_VITVI|nr:hypothetical protein CK203_054745 [Vitis vinifera]